MTLSRVLPSLPLSLPDGGGWQLRILATQNRFIAGYLGTIDKLLGVPVTTRNWNTVAAIIKVLQAGGGRL